MAKIKQLKHKGENIYPLTHTQAVVDSEGKTLEDILERISGGDVDAETIENIISEKLHYSNFTPNKTLDQKGNILDSDDWNVTNPIAVAGNKTLTFECGGTNTAALCEYDADGNFVDYWGQVTHPRTITTKANTAYVRMAVPNAAEYDYYIEQNGVKLFSALIDYNIAEQGVVVGDDGETLLNREGKISPRTTTANVVDENGKKLNEILNELASGGGEGALVYNAQQNLTDEQKDQVAKNIGQPRERLILEWSNEDAEVLQPIAYDSATGYFTVETMPSWLANDNDIVFANINYSDDVYARRIDLSTIPIPKGNEVAGFYVKRVSFNEVKLFEDKAGSTEIAIPNDVNSYGFSLNEAMPVAVSIPSRSEGVAKYKIVLKHISLIPSRYNRISVSGYTAYIATNAQPYYDLGLGYIATEGIDCTVEIELFVDHANYQARYDAIKCYGTLRKDNGLSQFVHRPLYGPLRDIYYNSKPRITFGVWDKAIKRDSIVELYEIIE